MNKIKTSETSNTSDIEVKFIRAKHWWRPSHWELTNEYISANKEIIVPAGFVTDGASIPRTFRMFFSPTGRYFGAAIVHDYILFSAPHPQTKETWNKANYQFEKELKALNIAKWRLWIILNGVKLWALVKVNIVDPLKKLFKKNLKK